MIDNFIVWFNQDWKYSEQKLAAKRNFLLSLIFLNILKNLSGNVSLHTTATKMRKDYQKKIIQLLKDSATIFRNNDLVRLCLRAKITALQLYTWQLNQKKKTNIGQTLQFYQQLSEKQRQTVECERIYTQRKNNLIAFAEFEIQIKNLKKLLKQKLWQMSSNTLVCMRAVPITINGQDPIIENLFRKKNKFRKQIQNVIDPHVDVCSKFQILTRQKLKQQVENGCTILLLSANVKTTNNGIPNLVFEGARMDEDLIPINQNFINEFDMSKIKILIIAGKNACIAITYLAKIIDDPPIMISLGKRTKYNQLQDFKQFNQEEYLFKENQYFSMIQTRKKAQIQFLKQFMKNVFQSQKITSKQQIFNICLMCRQMVRDRIDVQIQYKKRQSPIQIIKMKGSYKDLSPGYQKNHNIDMKIKLQNSNLVVLRRWKQTYRVFQYLNRKLIQISQDPQKSNPACINVFGDIGSGKTHFVHQIARILVQRQKFSSGVFIIQGKILQKRYCGQFQSYFQKQSQSGRIITLQDFQTNADQRLMLIIDDFHLVKPRSNGRFVLFMQKLIQTRVNLIIVTHQPYQPDFIKQTGFMFKKIKPVQIQRLYPFEIDLIAYNILDFNNINLLKKYQELRQSKKNKQNIRVKEIIQLKNAFYNKNKQNQFGLVGLGYIDQIKKMVSNQV